MNKQIKLFLLGIVIFAIILIFGLAFDSTPTFVVGVCLVSLAFVFLCAYLKSPRYKGIVGEKQVARVLNKVAKKKGGYVINDIIIPDPNIKGKTSQIDHIIITKDFVAAIETKNWAGAIYGNEEDREWTQVLANGNVKNSKYNPIKQNFTHVCRLVDLLELKHGVIDSYVCFPKADISHIQSDKVFTLAGLKLFLLGLKHKSFPDSEIKLYKELLQNLKDNPIQSHKEHVKEIRKMQRDVQNGICPRCGGKLVLRKGPDGKEFLGCSNYPRCKFTKKY